MEMGQRVSPSVPHGQGTCPPVHDLFIWLRLFRSRRGLVLVV